MNAIPSRAKVAELVAPMSPAPVDADERSARERLISAGIVTGREPSAMAALERFVDQWPARREMLGGLLDGKEDA